MAHEHKRYLKRQKNFLYSAVFVLLALQVASITIIIIQISNLDNEIEKTKSEDAKTIKELGKNLTAALDDYSKQSQQKFNDIVQSVRSQQTSFDEQISQLKSSSGDFSSIIDEAVKGVVGIGTDRASGSGFIINAVGLIVTNYHVIEGAQRIDILTYDAEVYHATIVGIDVKKDIALLRVEGRIYSPLQLTDSDKLQVGQKVIAIGNPLGLSFSVTEGIISGLHRSGPNELPEYIQTDVPLNPGNSGGPLIDKSGKVVGINNFKVGNAEGLGFALESNVIREVVNRLANQTLIQ